LAARIEELFAKTEGNQFASINRPTAGAREEVDVPEGIAPLQLYSLGTPNGVKVTILLEELEDLGLTTYDAHTVNIMKGEQFNSGFVNINPNSKIPALVHKKGKGKGEDITRIHLFESGSINVYLCDEFNVFLPSHSENPSARAEIMNWTMFQMGCQGPMTGQFGHFFCYAPADKIEARDYSVARYGMEVQRLLDVMEKHLSNNSYLYLVDNEYSLADIMNYPWVRWLRTGYEHTASGIKAGAFLNIESNYPHLMQWCDRIAQRPAVQRGVQVNGWADMSIPKPWLVKKEVETEKDTGK
jgi:GSH-dependent disulfide-bond oxidoreductase